MQKIIRDIFVGLDNVIYETIMDVYDLLLTIARTSIMSQAQITEFANRIYQLLAIFMIFKVTLSLITYVVNPDSFTEKGQGVGPLIKNIIISLSLLVLTPYIFNMAFEAQTYLLEGNTIPKLIFGDKGDDTAEKISSAGEIMSFTAMNAFVSPNTAISELNSCTEMLNENGYVNKECSGIEIDEATGLPKDGTSGSGGIASVATDDMAKNYVAGIATQNYYLTFREDLLTKKAKNSKEFVMTYHYFISTAVGIVMLLLLINFCMDIAVRSIKLSFYQLIAPIPIISYIDPKNGKDGIFKKWYKAAASTYLSLFIRLFVIYFSIYLISQLAETNIYDVVTGQIISGGFLLKVFMLIGVLMFAKQMPKILENLGLKIDGGGFTLNPLKKIGNEAPVLKRIGAGAVGATVGGIAAGGMGALSRYKNATALGKTKKSALISAAGGMGTGLSRGMIYGVKKGGIAKNVKSGLESQKKADDAHFNLLAEGGSTAGKIKSKVQDTFGTTEGQKYARELANYNALSGMRSNMIKNVDEVGHIKGLKDAWENMRQRDGESMEEFIKRKSYAEDTYKNARKAAINAAMSGLEKYEYKLKDENGIERLSGPLGFDKSDLAYTLNIASEQKKMNSYLASHNVTFYNEDHTINNKVPTEVNDFDEASAIMGAGAVSSASIRLQPDYASSMANDKAAGVETNRVYKNDNK